MSTEKFRLMTPKDYTLTPAEMKKLKNQRCFVACCVCCSDREAISEIIGRNIYSCQNCSCCDADVERICFIPLDDTGHDEYGCMSYPKESLSIPKNLPYIFTTEDINNMLKPENPTGCRRLMTNDVD